MRTQLNLSRIVVLMTRLVVLLALSLGLTEISQADRHVQTSATEEWTALQKEVWRTVETYSEASHNRDLEKYLSFWHPDFLGWYNGDTHPTNYKERSGGLEYYFGTTKSLEYELEPMGIQIVGDRAAIVHYKLRNVIQNIKSGKTSHELSYWTDYLTLENGQWLLVSDHGGNVPAEEG